MLDVIYNNVLESFQAKGFEIITSYKGILTPEKVNAIAYEIEGIMKEKGDKKGVVKGVFSIIIETLQNIRLHGEKGADGIQKAFLIVSRNEDEYIISTGNFVFDKNRERIENKIKHINKLDRPDLKKYYMEILTDGERSSKGGAGLGFITIATKSKNKLSYDFKNIGNNLSLFSLDSRVSLN